jgi:glycosyltransferase involved in cell wall biosynthesis
VRQSPADTKLRWQTEPLVARCVIALQRIAGCIASRGTMRIAQIAPLMESVPPRLYGGTERVVSYLTEELVRQGHDVTLFASGDSVTTGKLVPCSAQALRLTPDVKDALLYHIRMLNEVCRRASDFDIFHFHIDMLQYLLMDRIANRCLTTMHGRLDLPDYHACYSAFPNMPLVSISMDQRLPMPPVKWAGCVFHGLPPDLLQFNANPKGDYLAFLGRISPEKRPDRAIQIAAQSGRNLRIAAKIDVVDRSYWTECIEPLVRAHPNVEYIGEIGDADKSAFLGNATALLFPIDWAEPFGLVMIEAMACGTPVIAWRSGSVPEVIDEATTGFTVRSMEEAVAAVDRVEKLDRLAIRRVFDRRFTVERMAADYVSIYRRLAGVPASLPVPLSVPVALLDGPVRQSAIAGRE